MTELTLQQRREAWQRLALSEASDGDSIEHEMPSGAAIPDVGKETMRDDLLVPLSPRRARPLVRAGADLVAELGQRRLDSIDCPHCECRHVARWGQASGIPRYRCSNCRRTFNALTKTPLAHLRMKEKWVTQTEALIDGVGTAKAANRCGVDYKTAFRWRHRFLASLAGDKPRTLSGIVEGDETFILESFKGKRSDLPRKPRKRGGKAAKRGLSAEQIPVIVARDRQGATTLAVPEGISCSMLSPSEASDSASLRQASRSCGSVKSVIPLSHSSNLAMPIHRGLQRQPPPG